MFGVPWRAGESYMLDYGVINSEQSRIDPYWKSSTDQKMDIHFHECFE